jgi:hypothetical protein
MHLPGLVCPSHVIIFSLEALPHEVSELPCQDTGALYLPWMCLKQYIMEPVLVFPVLRRRRASTYHSKKEIESRSTSRRYTSEYELYRRNVRNFYAE